MENTTLKDLVNEYRSIEINAHVDLDDIINKVTQEVSELVEAIISWNRIEMAKEAADSVVNILSASSSVWVQDIKDRWGRFYDDGILNKDFGKLFVDLGKWNQKMQALRKRYSREDGCHSCLKDATNDLIDSVLAFVEPKINLSNMVSASISKFSKRVEAYLSKIDLKDHINEYSSFPKEWIEFKDISPILRDPEIMRYITFELAKYAKDADVIAGLDARWFLFWQEVAKILWKPFVMVRKAWKLPWKTHKIAYSLEYGKNEIEIQQSAIKKWQKVALIDDLLATWWTMLAAAKLVEEAGWQVQSIGFVISLDEKSLSESESRKDLKKYQMNSIVSYD